MTVGKICRREVDVAAPDDRVREAAHRMAKRQVGTLIILDPHQRPVGIVTDRDLAVRVLAAGRDPDRTAIADVMTAAPAVVDEPTPIDEALARMRALGVRRLPVVGSDGRLVGIVTLDDFLDLVAEEFGHLGALLAKAAPHGGPPL